MGAEVAASPAPAVGSGGSLHDDVFWRRLTLAPTGLFFVLLTVLPLANLFLVGFFDVRWADQQAVWSFVGTANYTALPADGLFRAGISNTIVFVLVAVAMQVVLGLALALFCSRVWRGRTLYRMIFLLPILIPGIVIGAIWKLLYNFDFGVINQLTGLFGLDPRDWLGDSATALAAVIAVDVWHWTPFCFLLLLASIESLPAELHEAARIDGASAWQEFWWVTLPMLAGAILVTAMFRAITAFKVFDEVFLLTGGGPGTSTEVVSFTIYQRFFTEDRVGYGAAMSIATMFVVALLLILALATRRREGSGP